MSIPISIEFFPPRSDEAQARLLDVHTRLSALRPEYVSVTYGAGGTTRAGTLRTVEALCAAGAALAPHISCIGASAADIRELLTHYQSQGITRLVALRGDLPSGAGANAGEFRYGVDLVEFIRRETGRHFQIEVAAYPEIHPQARSATDDLAHFCTKARAGADRAITQYFYNADAYARFRDEVVACGVDIPIVPGIMPITNFTQLARFSDATGAEIPRWVRQRLAGFGDDRAAIRAFGLDVVSTLCERLIRLGAPGLHFYTMNQSEAVLELGQRMGGPASRQPASVTMASSI